MGFHKLNINIKLNVYLLPFIADLLDTLSKAKILY